LVSGRSKLVAMLAPQQQQQQLRRRVDAAVAEDTRVQASVVAATSLLDAAVFANCPAAAASQAVDAAKKAAIRQRVDVETFQALVSAAHLRPMQGGLRFQPGHSSKPSTAHRHFLPDGTIAPLPSSTSIKPRSGLPSPTATDNALRSGADFQRAWRAAPAGKGRLPLLRRAWQAGALPRLLKLEVNSRLLEDVLDCLVANVGADEADGVTPTSGRPSDAAGLAAAVLEAAASASAFEVALAGLPLQCRRRLASLVHGLEASGVASSALLQAYARHEVAQGKGCKSV
jgi:hypothetical protein